MRPAPITLQGRPVGRLRASWLLFKEAWRFFKADPELFWVPIIFGLMCILAVVAAVGLLTVALLGYEGVSLAAVEEVPAPLAYGFIFLIYIASAFTYALAQASVVYTVATRVHGGNATLGESLRAALSHALTLFVWSLITSTIGLILRVISERSQLIGRIMAALIGAAWAILTYFVVTAVVLERQTAVPAIKRSAHVFRSTWGETFLSNISLGLTFFLAHVVAFLIFVGFIVIAAITALAPLYIVGFVLYFVWLFVAIFVHEVLHAVLKTLLYIYATEQTVPTNFDQELLANMLARTTPKPVGTTTFM